MNSSLELDIHGGITVSSIIRMYSLQPHFKASFSIASTEGKLSGTWKYSCVGGGSILINVLKKKEKT